MPSSSYSSHPYATVTLSQPPQDTVKVCIARSSSTNIAISRTVTKRFCFYSDRWFSELLCASATPTTPSRTDDVSSRPLVASSFTSTSRSPPPAPSAVTATSPSPVSRRSAPASTLLSARGSSPSSALTVVRDALPASELGEYLVSALYGFSGGIGAGGIAVGKQAGRQEGRNRWTIRQGGFTSCIGIPHGIHEREQ